MSGISEIVMYDTMEKKNKSKNDSLEGEVIAERPLTIYLNEEEIVTLLCTPQHQEELAVGFLVAEGFLGDRADLQRVQVDREKGLAWVQSDNTPVLAQRTFLKRYITTGCGKGTSFYHYADSSHCHPVTSSLLVKAEEIWSLMKEMQRMGELYRRTRGSHSAALGTTERILFLREDVGRHNAADKVLGRCFLDNISLEDKLLLTTGRLSSEIMVKAAKMGVPILASRSAPSDLSIQLAKELGVTLVGSVRGGRLNIYTHNHRVVL
ncbi:MAG TPA: formate dehydrogenase accessory sulfurtransferase FdhD [Clostridia bacterium]|nr:formate dehydrogenase accessory sulfurtransferase FdhD [Clostridia bacterium]